MSYHHTIKLFLIIAFLFSENAWAQIAKGKVLGEQLEICKNALVENLGNGIEVYTNESGWFEIKATIGDTIRVSSIGYDSEQRKFNNEILRIILIDRSVNCLGAEWSAKQYKKAFRYTDKRYKKLYKKAENLNLWN